MSGFPLLQIDNLRQVRRTPESSGSRPIFDSVSFILAPGEQVAIVGERAAGKTELARAIALIERPAGGRVSLNGEDITRAWGGRLRALRRSLQYVGGDPRRSLSPRMTIERVLAEPLEVHHLGSAAERRARVAAAASAWQLNPLILGQLASALSTGQCQRVALARACLLQPRVLVCDEIVERLEPSAVRPLLDRLARFCRAARLAWLWTTADAGLAGEFSNRVLVLENGRLRPA